MLRLVLVLQVVFGHYAIFAYPTFDALDLSVPADALVATYRLTTRFGAEAAYVFVALSGYFLVGRLVDIGRGSNDNVILFLKRRLARIYPTLLAAIVLTLLCDLAATRLLDGEQLYRTVAGYDMVAALNWRSGLGNVLSLQPTFAGPFGSNGPLWTLGYIVQFYAIGAGLAALARHSVPAMWVVFVVLLLSGLWWNPQGALLFLAWAGCGLLARHSGLGGGKGVAAIVTGVVMFVIANPLPTLASVVLCGIASALMLAGLKGAHQNKNSGGGSGGGGAVLLAIRQASYPLYAFHFPVTALLWTLMRDVPDTMFWRLAWPIVALLPAIALALAWQTLLDRREAGRSNA